MKSRRRHARILSAGSRSSVPVLYGFDAELGNSVLGLAYPHCTSGEAARALLAEITGLPGDAYRHDCMPSGWVWHTSGAERSASTSTEYGRKFLVNGDCVYIDLDHLEVCLAERLDCFEFPAALHAGLHRVERARLAANAKLPAGQEIVVLANNSDGQGNSYGSHMNFLLPRGPHGLWDDIFHLKSLYLPYLASAQAAMIVLTGLGKVGSENGRPQVDYQIAQRPDFFVNLSSLETTHSRGLVNSRRESLCGPDTNSSDAVRAGYDRLHVIFFDWNLMPVAAILKCGLMQLVLAGMQRGLVAPELILETPVDAAIRFSHDPGLNAQAETIVGRKVTAVELLCMLAEELAPAVRAGNFDDLVPRAGQLFELFEDTLIKLRARDYVALASRLDWVLKWMLLQQEIDREPRLNWRSPEIKHLDQVYSSTAPEGLFNACARAGLVERMPGHSAVHRCFTHPPEDTRAWTRGRLLRAAGRWAVHINWDAVAFQAWEDATTCRCWRVNLFKPTGFTRREAEPVFRRAGTLDELFRGLNQLQAAPRGAYDHPSACGDESDGPCGAFEPISDRFVPVEADRRAQADPCPTSSQVGGDVHA
jgi:Pup amidohydrolase